MPREQNVKQDDLYRLLAAIKFLADDAEKRSNLVQSQLEIRDISIDQLLEHRDQAVMVLDLFKQFFKGCREVRAEFEDERDRDWGISDAQWFAAHVADMNRADMADSENIKMLGGETADLRKKLKETNQKIADLEAALLKLLDENDTQ